jgi:hypothetical protein
MSVLDRLTGFGRRRSWGGSALPEPSEIEVYEGRLPEQGRPEPSRREPVVGANLLDGRGAEPRAWLARSSSAVHATTSTRASASREWAPWCVECRLEPVGGPWTLQGAEYLARQHDALWHGAAWTAQALPADEVVRLAAGGGAR